MSNVLIMWRADHAGEQISHEFGADWADTLRELHAERPCDCCTPTAFAPNGARAWVDETGEVVRGAGWE